jgi:hypothetical protein
MGGDDKQLLIAAAAALLVLGLGLVAYFSAGSGDRPMAEPPTDADDRVIVPAQPDLTLEKRSPPTGRAQQPLLTATIRDPRVRPEHLTRGVEQDLRASEAEFKACYATELETNPKAKGRALLQFSIDENSEVSAINVELRAIPSMALKYCLEAAGRTVVFGSVDEPALVWWPLLMWPDKGLSIQPPVGN